jgi:hypothetical protein
MDSGEVWATNRSPSSGYHGYQPRAPRVPAPTVSAVNRISSKPDVLLSHPREILTGITCAIPVPRLSETRQQPSNARIGPAPCVLPCNRPSPLLRWTW